MLKTKIAFLLTLVLLISGCATFKPPWPMTEFQKVKMCKNKEMKITFLVRHPSENPALDIFTKALRVKIETTHEEYGRIIVWLHYAEMVPPEERVLPEYPPEKIIVQSVFGSLKKKTGDYHKVWKTIMNPGYLTFIENCIYDF